jgi:hypothetical protein
LADLKEFDLIYRKYALALSVNQSLSEDQRKKLIEYKHNFIPFSIALNSEISKSSKSTFLDSMIDKIDMNLIDDWFSESYDSMEVNTGESLTEILQLLSLELLGFFGEGGDFPFWQLLEDSDLDPTHTLWSELSRLPKIPKILFQESPFAINLHIARELAGEKAIPSELLYELAYDDCNLASVDNGDLWFATRSPRASVASNKYSPAELISQIIFEEITSIEKSDVYEDESLSVLWRVVGNSSITEKHIELILDFVSRSLERCADSSYKYDVLSLLEGGKYVDLPLIENSNLIDIHVERIKKLLGEINTINNIVQLMDNPPENICFEGSSAGLENNFLEWLKSEIDLDLLFIENDEVGLANSGVNNQNLKCIQDTWLLNHLAENSSTDSDWQIIDANAESEIEFESEIVPVKFHALSQMADDSKYKRDLDSSSNRDLFKISLFRTGERSEYDPDLDRSELAFQCLVLMDSSKINYEDIECEINWIRLGERDYPLQEISERELVSASLLYRDKFKIDK